MKLLVNHPDLSFVGGVANHYQGLRRYWSAEVYYNTVGKRKVCPRLGYILIFWDILKFILKILFYRPDAVVINPSLGVNALRRDFLFLRIAKLLGCSVIVFLHGFNLEYAKIVDKKWVCEHLNQASLVFVLANSFRSILRSWGVVAPIELTTTKVDDKLLIGLDQDYEEKLREITELLFLARVDRAKGIYEAINAFELLAERYSSITLTIVGDGDELEAVQAYVAQCRFSSRISLLGALRGEDLKQAYHRAQLYILPSYGEGMPTSVLEAMAFGLPVFTRKVGGLVDFFNDNMGYITDSIDPQDFASAIEPYLNDMELYQRVSKYNREYAQTHFMASRVALDIENKIEKYIFGNKV